MLEVIDKIRNIIFRLLKPHYHQYSEQCLLCRYLTNISWVNELYLLPGLLLFGQQTSNRSPRAWRQGLIYFYNWLNSSSLPEAQAARHSQEIRKEPLLGSRRLHLGMVPRNPWILLTQSPAYTLELLGGPKSFRTSPPFLELDSRGPYWNSRYPKANSILSRWFQETALSCQLFRSRS